MANAWLETDRSPAWDWTALGEALTRRRSAALLERARLLGLAVAPAAGLNAHDHAPPHCETQQLGPTNPPRPGARPLVVDLGALWAGPLCSHLLWLCGARVIKVEAPTRPDGAREGNPEFYELLNQGKSCLALDLRAGSGRQALRRLLAQADIVIEGSRPRALLQLGIDPASLLRGNPGLTWVSITATAGARRSPSGSPLATTQRPPGVCARSCTRPLAPTSSSATRWLTHSPAYTPHSQHGKPGKRVAANSSMPRWWALPAPPGRRQARAKVRQRCWLLVGIGGSRQWWTSRSP